MTKTKKGGWAAYKKLVKRPDQIKGRALLRKAIDDAVKALNIMYASYWKTEKAKTGDNIKTKYAFAAYYIFKYLIETKEFDSIAELHGYILHMIWQREDGSWTLLDNELGSAGNRIGVFMRHVGQFLESIYREKPEEEKNGET